MNASADASDTGLGRTGEGAFGTPCFLGWWEKGEAQGPTNEGHHSKGLGKHFPLLIPDSVAGVVGSPSSSNLGGFKEGDTLLCQVPDSPFIGDGNFESGIIRLACLFDPDSADHINSAKRGTRCFSVFKRK